MDMKSIIKRMLTIIMHPIVSIHLMREGTRNFYIGSRLNVKRYRYFHLGCNSTIGKDARLLSVLSYMGGCYNPCITIGDNVYIAYHFTAMSAAPITIGDNSLIASGVVITSENHGVNPEITKSYADTPLEAKPVSIGNGCWIGENAIITPGVKLGERCIVAAGAVVTKSFPPYSMIGGVPAKLIKTYNTNTHQWEKV